MLSTELIEMLLGIKAPTISVKTILYSVLKDELEICISSGRVRRSICCCDSSDGTTKSLSFVGSRKDEYGALTMLESYSCTFKGTYANAFLSF